MTGRRRVLAVASGGGHWVQLLRLRPAFEGCDVTYACVRPAYADDVPGEYPMPRSGIAGALPGWVRV